MFIYLLLRICYLNASSHKNSSNKHFDYKIGCFVLFDSTMNAHKDTHADAQTIAYKAKRRRRLLSSGSRCVKLRCSVSRSLLLFESETNLRYLSALLCIFRPLRNCLIAVL